MTVKEYLRRAYRANELIEADLRELEAIRASPVQGVRYKPGKIPDGKRSDSTASLAAKIMALEDKINGEIDQLITIRKEVRELINKDPDPTEQLLLQMRYLEFQPWGDIADALHYSLRSVHRLHAHALDVLAVAFVPPD